MRSIYALLAVCLCVYAESRSLPKAPGTGLLKSAPAVIVAEGNALTPLQLEEHPGHQLTENGDSLLLLKLTSPGAPGVRLHIRDMRLPEGAILFAYSVDEGGAVRKLSGPHTGSGSFWTSTLPGDTAFVEVQWGDEVPGDIPFEVPELSPADPNEATPELPPTTHAQDGVIGSAMYRGRQLTYEIRGGLAMFEEDIVLGTADELSASSGGKNEYRRDAVGITGSFYRWPGGVIPYVIATDLPTPSRATDAIAHWNTKLGGVVKFVARTTQANYVKIVRGSGCSSYVGMVNIGPQNVTVSDSCSTGNVIHELGHAVGLWHEQSREDRNSHVRILWANVSSTKTYNFNQNITNGDDIGSYDFGSIMHYGTHSFSSNGQPTIETIPAGIPIGQRVGLSAGDIAGSRLMYGATAQATSVTVTIGTSPSALQVKVDGTLYTAPRSFTWPVGSTHTVEAVETTSSGKKNKFVKWSDSGARTHSLTAASTVTAYTATYAVQYIVSVSGYPASTGTSTASPASADQYYAANSSLSLKATAAAGYCFNRWENLVAGTPSNTTLTVTKAYWPIADFIPGSITLSPTSKSVSAAGGSFALSVSATTGCLWAAKSNASWITITSGKTGTGPLTLGYSVAANTSGLARTGTIAVEGKVHTITQY